MVMLGILLDCKDWLGVLPGALGVRDAVAGFGRDKERSSVSLDKKSLLEECFSAAKSRSGTLGPPWAFIVSGIVSSLASVMTGGDE